MLYTMTINGMQIAFDEHGHDLERPALVLLSGWGGDHRVFDRMMTPLIAAGYRVIRVNWRAHGPDRTPIAEFGREEQVADTVALLDILEVERFVPVSISQGGWAALDIADQLGAARVPGVMLVDLIMTSPPQEFIELVHAMQHRETWREARAKIFAQWAGGTTHPALQDMWLSNTFPGHSFETWLSGNKAVEKAYVTWGSPMARMEKIASPRPIRHLFSQEPASGYDELHEQFAAGNPWFSWRRLHGVTHFPTVELPDTVCVELGRFVESLR